MPAADLVMKVAECIEESSSELVKRDSGQAMPAKALATLNLKVATGKAKATRKRLTKAATRRASTIVAATATETSNAVGSVADQSRTAVPLTATIIMPLVSPSTS